MELNYLANNLDLTNWLGQSDFQYPPQSSDYVYSPDYLIGQDYNIVPLNVNHSFEQILNNCEENFIQIDNDVQQCNLNNGVAWESTAFLLSPQSILPSSAEQSPQLEDIDYLLNDLPEFDAISNNEELFEVLNNAGCTDLLDICGIEIDSSSDQCSTASSTPKRKYSTDSSDCYSLDSFETSSTGSQKSKRTRRSKHTKEERAVRKKDQNKKAALRYRDKKKNIKQRCEKTVEELETERAQLDQELNKLQTEFNVILPLAKAAFAMDSTRAKLLQDLLSRINSLE